MERQERELAPRPNPGGSIIGETASHELGHSLGLAQPLGERTTFHHDSDGDGGLMDRPSNVTGCTDDGGVVPTDAGTSPTDGGSPGAW